MNYQKKNELTLLITNSMNPKKVHLFFEQSGTFKREFIKLGVPAIDYDILNDYGETDIQMDLFSEIIIATHTHTHTIKLYSTQSAARNLFSRFSPVRILPK